MSKLFNLVRAFGRISSYSLISTSQERCLNMRYNRVFCNKCEHICGVDALSLDHIPVIDGTACAGCGVCVNVCPTGAFALRDISKEDILSSIKSGGKVVFSCRGMEACGIEETDCAAHAPVPCIGYLCEGMLLKAASISEKVIIDKAGCHHCALKIDLDAILKKVGVANTILETFGRNPNIELSAVGTGDASVKDAFGRKSIDYLRNVHGGNDKDTNHDTANDGNSSKNANGDNVDDIDGIDDVKSSGELSIIPMTHTLLIDAIFSLGEPVINIMTLESGPLYDLDIVDACVLCGICAAVCPTGALRFVEDGAIQSIGFNISSCIGCDVCRQVCKNNAIRYNADMQLSDVMSSDWKSLISHERMQCKSCKKYINSIKKDSLCSSCSLEQDVEKQFLQ